MSRVITIDGPKAATKLLMDVSVVKAYGLRLCHGCDEAIMTDSIYCGRCSEEVEAMEERWHQQRLAAFVAQLPVYAMPPTDDSLRIRVRDIAQRIVVGLIALAAGCAIWWGI